MVFDIDIPTHPEFRTILWVTSRRCCSDQSNYTELRKQKDLFTSFRWMVADDPNGGLHVEL